MKCAYCRKETKGTKEHIISSAILDLFPECYLTFDDIRKKIYSADPVIKDVCAECNNHRISYIDSYAKAFIGRYFVKKYKEDDVVEIEYDYTLTQKMLLKYAFNDMRLHKEDISFFTEEVRSFLMNEDDKIPKNYVSVFCGIAVNVSPLPDAAMGNIKLRWCMNPMLFSNSTIRYINYETGQMFLNEDIEFERFQDLRFSYAFRFNSVQFLLFCWDIHSPKIDQNNIVIEYQYPYYRMRDKDGIAKIPVCTDEMNYHHFEMIHVCWDELFEAGTMRRLASGDNYKYKEAIDKLWLLEEQKLREEHPRGG